MGRRICVVTGSRAEYGLLQFLMKEIAADDALQLQIVVTGMHLSPEFGLTYREIEADGFTIDERVEMLMSSDSGVGMAKSMGLGTIGFADAFARLAPDIVVLLGDRFEIFAAAQAAMAERIPIAHIHGGERTEGAIDEAIRHAVTKLAHLHFVAAEPYRQRVIQLGESPKHVYCFGAPGLDQVTRLNYLTRTELEEELHFRLSERFFLVTYHPVTLEGISPESAMHALFAALDAFPEANVLFTKPNADSAGHQISRLIDAYQARQPDRVYVSVSLGQRKYLSAMKLSSVVIGNSSSGLIEAPLVGTPTVNVGRRQQGRLKATSVIDCVEKAGAIEAAICKAESGDFRGHMAQMVLPYGAGNASYLIKEQLKQVSLDGLLQKTFYDLPSDCCSEGSE